MRIASSVVLSSAALFVECYALGQPPSLSGTNSYDLAVTVSHAGSRELSMLITIGTEEPFKLSATSGRQHAEISGILHLKQGKFLLDFTLIEPGGTSAASGYPLELGKLVGYKNYDGIVYRHVSFKLQRHEVLFGSFTPTRSPNHPTAANPAMMSRFHADGDWRRVADWKR